MAYLSAIRFYPKLWSRHPSLWSPVLIASHWLHKAAKILDNEAQLTAEQVRIQFRNLLGVMARWQSKVGTLQSGIVHFLKVTRSYWSGLFHCYEVEGLPRTNNDLEHLLGKWRHHHRRCTLTESCASILHLAQKIKIQPCFEVYGLVATNLG